jgi:threonine dehydratase
LCCCEGYFLETRTVPEPTGALALAGLKKYISQKRIKNKNLIATYCGSNLNFESLGHIVERSKIGEKKEIILSIAIDEKKGSFRKLCRDIGQKNITEFSYRKDNSSSAKILLD